MKQAKVVSDGQTYTVDIKELNTVEKVHIAAEAPQELLNAADGDDPQEIEEVELDLTEDVVDYLVDVATRVTELEQKDIDKLTIEETIKLSTEILDKLFEDDDDSTTGDRVKRLRLTDRFIESLFKAECAMVAGVPDDAKFKDFHYDPSRKELQFIFSSDEWQPVPEGEEIPVFEAASVEIGSSTENI